LKRADAAADGKGNKYLFRGAAHGFKQRGPFLMGGGDVEKNNFVRARMGVSGRQFGGISGITQIEKLCAFDDAAGVNIETSDNSFR
jgi:hypothetical protein